MKDEIEQRIRESIAVKELILGSGRILSQIEALVADICNALRNGNKVLFAGNGGSFADSIHFAGEFVSRFMFDRAPLPALALGGNTSILTSVGNDYSFQDVFYRELIALGNGGDVFIPISTSGNSPNIIKAIQAALKKEISVCALTGKNGGKIGNMCNAICVPSESTPRVQEGHSIIGHIVCELVECEMFLKGERDEDVYNS